MRKSCCALPQHAALIYIIVVPDMHGQKVDTENCQIPPALKGDEMRSGGWTRIVGSDNFVLWLTTASKGFPSMTALSRLTLQQRPSCCRSRAGAATGT